MMLRPDLRPARYPQLTQGTVFCCATAERYRKSDVYGLVITAKCDIAQNKYPVLNYLPLVRLQDWLRQDGLDILIENEKAGGWGSLKGLLKQAQLSPTLLDAIALEEIAEKNFPLESGNKAKDKISQSFRKAVDEFQTFQHLTETEDRETIFTWFAIHRGSAIDDIINRLSRHSITGYYLFETLDIHRVNNSAYVSLLREVNTLPKIIAELIGGGLLKERFQELNQLPPHVLSFLFNDLAMPIVEIGSPTIEHLLQSFSNLFGRIGIADPDPDVIMKIKELAVRSEGVEQ